MIYERVIHQYRDRETGITVFLPTDKVIKIEEMRTIKELLVLLREFLPNQDMDNWWKYSMCFGAIDLYDAKTITNDEYCVLDKYIEDHKPVDAGCFGVGFWWPVGELAPRLEFLDKLINELKDE